MYSNVLQKRVNVVKKQIENYKNKQSSWKDDPSKRKPLRGRFTWLTRSSLLDEAADSSLSSSSGEPPIDTSRSRPMRLPKMRSESRMSLMGLQSAARGSARGSARTAPFDNGGKEHASLPT